MSLTIKVCIYAHILIFRLALFELFESNVGYFTNPAAVYDTVIGLKVTMATDRAFV